MVHLVLNKEVYQWQYSSVKCARKVFAILYSSWVLRAQSDHTERPRDGREQIRYHEDIMPVVVIGRGDISPSAASHCPENAHSEDELGQRRVRLACENIPQPN